MSDYKILGLNIWTYSDARAIIWLGNKNSHFSEKKHYAKIAIGRWGYLGAEITVGGEDREIMLRLGLGFLTIYFGVTNLIKNKYEKAQEIAKKAKCYAYEIDYSNEGRTSGIMISFKDIKSISFNFWDNGDYWTSRKVREKLKHFPYCEGISKSYYFNQ